MAASGTSFGLDIEPTLAAVARARRDARRALDGAQVPAPVAVDLELVISELASNAVEQQPTAAVRLDVTITDAAVYLRVANETTSSDPFELPVRPSGMAPDGVLADRGRGLPIVMALTDELWVDIDGPWTSVNCLRRFGHQPG